MAVGWSRRKPEEPDHPDQVFKATVVGFDPGNPSGVTIGYIPLHPVSYAPPEGEQEPGVIEPTALFKSHPLSESCRDNAEVTVEYYD
jgi:hypothetical protein